MAGVQQLTIMLNLHLVTHCNLIIICIELRFNEDFIWSANDLFASGNSSFDNALNGDEYHVVMSQNGEFNVHDNGLIIITLINAVNITSLSDDTSLHGL